MDYKKPNVTLLHATPLNVAEIAARSCYNSFLLSEHEAISDFPITKMLGEDITSSAVLDKLVWVHHHESVVEHVHLSYFIENISREVLIEMNRHRIAVETSQQSTRYTMEAVVDAWIDFRDIDTREAWGIFVDTVADFITDTNPHMIYTTANYIAGKLTVYDIEEPLIKGLTGSKKKKQNDRVKRCLPEVWLTKGVWTFNLRSLKHFMSLRDSGAAYYGIREVAQAIINATPEHYLQYIRKVKHDDHLD